MQIALHYKTLRNINFANSVSTNRSIYVTQVLHPPHSFWGSVIRRNFAGYPSLYLTPVSCFRDIRIRNNMLLRTDHLSKFARPLRESSPKETTEQSYINRTQIKANYFPWNSCYLLCFHVKQLSFVKDTFHWFSLYITKTDFSISDCRLIRVQFHLIELQFI